MKTDYARRKLTILLAEIDCYTDEEFTRQMMRIILGATGFDVVIVENNDGEASIDNEDEVIELIKSAMSKGGVQ